MARPSVNEMHTEERLSLAAGDLSGAIEAIGAAAAYVRMMLRREPRLIEFAQAADRKMAGAIDAIDRAQGRIGSELNAAQALRTAANGGQKQRSHDDSAHSD